MPLIRGNPDQNALFNRLEHAARLASFVYNCVIAGSGEHMLVVLRDPVSGAEAWAYAGDPDAIVAAFEDWVDTQTPEA